MDGYSDVRLASGLMVDPDVDEALELAMIAFPGRVGAFPNTISTSS